MDNTNIIFQSNSDLAVLKSLGEYIRQTRLEQNKSQQQLADDAGINRSTLIEFEMGKNSTALTFIQLLRALNRLHLLETFEVKKQISPIALAEMEMKSRKRASKITTRNQKTTSDW